MRWLAYVGLAVSVIGVLVRIWFVSQGEPPEPDPEYDDAVRGP